MNSADRKTINNIMRINKYVPILQDKIEKEQARVIADICAPAIKTVNALIALDNRRIDLCNLNVLYGFIMRRLGEKFCVLLACVDTNADSVLYDDARDAIGECGYDIGRVRDEFTYLFKQLKTPRRVRKPSSAQAVVGNLRA